MKVPTASDMLAFIQGNEASLTFATSETKARSWRCHVWARHFLTPDRRERSGRMGYGNTAIKAIAACMNCAPDDVLYAKPVPAKARKK